MTSEEGVREREGVEGTSLNVFPSRFRNPVMVFFEFLTSWGLAPFPMY